MVYVKPFKGIRPGAGRGEEVSALPYDVMNRAEAREMAKGNPCSFLHISRSEIDCDDSVGDYEPVVYEKARDNIDLFLKKGILVQEEKPVYYIYREAMNGRVQTGLVAAVSVDDYVNGDIVRHEFTRKEKEQDRINHFNVCSCHTEPSFLTYRDNLEINGLLADWADNHQPLFDFVSEDGIGHTQWVVDDDAYITKLTKALDNTPKLYIADGHHRTASSAKVRDMRQRKQPEEEMDFFMAVIFPAPELYIMAYNRVVDLPADTSPEEIINTLKKSFETIDSNYEPPHKHTFSVYADGKWYGFKMKADFYRNENPVDNLDCAILQSRVFKSVFGIDDPRTDKRIDFIGGIRGYQEIEKLCRGGSRIGFVLYPVEIDDLMEIADSGEVMPPKSTWFEPKLRSGLFLHRF